MTRPMPSHQSTSQRKTLQRTACAAETASRREERDLVLLRRYHDRHDTHARDELAERFMPLVHSIVRGFRSTSEPLEDVVQAGSVGLVKAIDRFDVDSGHRFISFAAPTIRGEVQRHFRDHCWDVHVPRSVQELGQRIKAHERQSFEDRGRETTVEELVDALQVGEAQIADARAGSAAYDALSLDQPAGEDREVMDLHGCVDQGYRQVDDDDVIDRAMDVLTDREREVLRWRFRDELLQREIAARIGVSQMQVSRIIRDSLERMNAGLLDDRPRLAA